MEKRKQAWGLICAVVLAAFAVFVLGRDNQRYRLTQLFPGGYSVRVGGVFFTNGPVTFRVTAVTGWRSKLYDALPKRVGSLLGWQRLGGAIRMAGGGMATNLVVFTVNDCLTNSGFSYNRLVVHDELGNTFDAGGSTATMTSSNGTNTLRINGWSPSAFPRRGKVVGLRYYTSVGYLTESGECVVEFVIPNPARGTYPNWSPEPLPATKTDGELSITLASLKSGLSRRDQTKPAPGNEVAITLATFRISYAGVADKTWQPIAAEISDATGNHWTAVGDSPARDGTSFAFKGALWPGESAWKMRFEFNQTQDFKPDEIFHSVIIPGMEQETNLNHALDSLLIATESSAKQGGYWVGSQTVKWTSLKRGNEFIVNFTQLPADCRLTLLQVTDEEGNKVEINDKPALSVGAQVYRFFTHTEINQLNFTYALRKSRYVEFLAKPQDLRAHAN